MNPRRIVRTLIVLLVAIVGRWIVRSPAAPARDPARPHPPPPQSEALTSESDSPLEAALTPASRPSLVSPADTTPATLTSVAVLEAPISFVETPVAVLETKPETFESPVAAFEHDPLREAVAAPGTSVATLPSPWTPREWQFLERDAEPEAEAEAEAERKSNLERNGSESERAEISESPDVAIEPVPAFVAPLEAPEASEPKPSPPPATDHVDHTEPLEAAGDMPPFAREPRRMRRRSHAYERPGRLLGGAGFLLAAIACFIASFVLFVRLTTPDRSAPAVYAVVPYVAASERDVPPALASFAGEVATQDMWLVVRLPVAARYVALSGLRTVDRWTTSQFALAGTKPTSASNAASCYSGVGVANGPPELTPLAAGLVVRDESTASLTTERLVRVDVGALLADATSTKTLVCAIAAPARTGFASYAATIGVPNVQARDATASRVKLSALPLAVDYSTFGNASAMRFTQTSLAVATDPLHATLDVAGFETFAYDDPEGDARRDVLLFLAGALATIGAVATADALRPWLGIERR